MAQINTLHRVKKLCVSQKRSRRVRKRSKRLGNTPWGTSLAFKKNTFESWVNEQKKVTKVITARNSSIKWRDPCVLKNLHDDTAENADKPKRLKSWKAEMVFLINDLRENYKLQSLRVNQNLSHIAGMRAKSLIALPENPSQTASDISKAKEIMRRYKNIIQVAETNLIVPDDGFHMGEVHRLTLRERNHAANVLRQNITEIGMDVVQGKDGRFGWSLIFGELRYPSIACVLGLRAPVELPKQLNAAKASFNRRLPRLQKKLQQITAIIPKSGENSDRLLKDNTSYCEKKTVPNQPTRSRLQCWKAELVFQINDVREEEKLLPLRVDKNLSVIARMATKSVVSAGDKSPELASELLTANQSLLRQRYNLIVAKTNFIVHEGNLGIGQIHRSMMQDQSYADNVLCQSVSGIGLNVAPGKDGKFYWTLIFGQFKFPAQYYKVLNPA